MSTAKLSFFLVKTPRKEIIMARRSGTHCLRTVREEKKIPLRELARAANINAAFLSKVERGKRSVSPEMAIQIENALLDMTK